MYMPLRVPGFALATVLSIALNSAHGQPATRFAVSGDGTRIAYEVTGTGPFLMLLHGGGQNRRVWHDGGYVDRLRRDFTVITVDMRGNGESDTPELADAYAIDKLQADLLAVADSARASRFAVWGFSYGANIGRYLARSSDRVTSMVYVGIPFGPSVEGVFLTTIREMQSRWHPVIARHRQGTLDVQSLPEQARAEWQRRNVPLMLAWLSAMVDYPPVEPSEMRVPTLWLVGTANTGAMESVQKYRERLAGTRVTLSLLDGLNHPQEFERIDTVMPVVLPFLARN
jgi:pimeloyl-ACP methyl ester carboxylesterase